MDTNPSPSPVQMLFSLPMRYVVFLICGVAIIVLGILLNEIYVPHTQLQGQTKSIEIPSGFGSRMIAEKLKTERFIRSKWIFELYVVMRGKASSLKPGNYVFSSNASIPSIAHALVKGSNEEKIITLPEGSTIKDISWILQQQDMQAGNQFELFAIGHQFPAFEKTFPFVREGAHVSGLEGYLFPDTYHFYKNATPEDIAGVFLQNFNRKVSEGLHEDIRTSKRTLRDIIIIASLIEREVISDQDRAVVSDILWKRLDRGIPLQVDATVLYAKRQENDNNKQTIILTLNDLAINSPYNTYKYRGLPLGPISNPGLSAILAAIYPSKSPYLYYLSAPNGQTIFSKTLGEHAAAKRKFLIK